MGTFSLSFVIQNLDSAMCGFNHQILLQTLQLGDTGQFLCPLKQMVQGQLGLVWERATTVEL